MIYKYCTNGLLDDFIKLREHATTLLEIDSIKLSVQKNMAELSFAKSEKLIKEKLLQCDVLNKKRFQLHKRLGN